MGFFKNVLGGEGESQRSALPREDATDALRAIPARERVALPEWTAAPSEHRVALETVGFVSEAVGTRIGAPPPGSPPDALEGVEFLSSAGVFAVAGADLVLISPEAAGVRVVKRSVAEVRRLGASPNGTYTDIVFDPQVGDQWRIRDPEEAIRGWFMQHGSAAEKGRP